MHPAESPLLYLSHCTDVIHKSSRVFTQVNQERRDLTDFKRKKHDGPLYLDMNSHTSHVKYSKRDLSHEGFQATQRRTMVHLFMMRFTCQLRSRGSGIFDNTAKTI
jgi:hypothetical protein